MEPARTVTVEIPFTIRKRGGRKQIVTPDGASGWVFPRARIDNTMIKAIARGFRWRMHECGSGCEGNAVAFLACRQPQCQGDMGFAGA